MVTRASPHEEHEPGPQPRRSLPLWSVLVIVTLVLGFFLLTEHRAHLLGFLPWLLLLACPLMHLFMHGGHGGHGGDRPDGDTGPEPHRH